MTAIPRLVFIARFTNFVALAMVSVCLLAAAAPARSSADADAERPLCVGADSLGGSPAHRLRAMRCLLDAARGDAGARRLHADPRLRRSAAAKARDIRRCHRFAHDPCGDPWQVGMGRAGYARGRHRVAENLAWVLHGTPRTVLRMWLGSSAHRANLLNPGYRDTGLVRRSVELPGIGVVELWVQHFGSRG